MRLRLVSLALPITLGIVFLTLALFSCGKGKSGSPHPSSGLTASGEIKAYAPPDDVDFGVFEMLRDEFLLALGENPERTSAAAPFGDAGKVIDLAYNPASGMLTWSYVNLGDYNLSGDVSIADVAEIARYYLADATDGIGDDPYESWVDGSGDGEVNIADVAPLAKNYLNEVAEYVILTSAISDAGFFEIGRISFSEAKTPSGITNQEGAHSWAPAGISRRGGQEWPPSGWGGEWRPGTPAPPKTPSQTGVNFPKLFEVALPVGALQFVAVQPVDSSDSAGERSNVAYVFSDEPPLPPSEVQASDGLPGIITLTWTKSVDAIGYKIYRDSQNAPIFSVGDVDTWNDMTVGDFDVHEYWLKAYSTAGDSDFSESDTGFMVELQIPPEPPTGLRASDGTYTSRIALTWTKSAGATGYKIYRDSQDAPIVEVGDVDNWDDTTVGDFDVHTYWLKATNPAGDSDFSESDSGYLWEPPIPPDPPTDLVASDGTYPDRISLTWTETAGVAGYKMFRDSQDEPIADLGLQGTWADTTVADFDEHTYWIKAYDFSGGSDFSVSDTGFVGTGSDMWHIEVVDSDGDVGSDTSIALDSLNNPHISYYDWINGDLKYAVFGGASWQIETVDSVGEVGTRTSIALDSSGNPHISYRDDTNADLKYAYYNGTSWQIETVDSGGDVGWTTSIAVDSSDYVHVSYYDFTNEDLKYAFFNGASWQIETVDSGGDVGDSTSIALDSSDNPHISYEDHGTYSDLKYAYYDGSSWQIETVDSEGWVGECTSIALDSWDNPHISFYDESNSDLKYAYYNGSVWTIQAVDTEGGAGWDTSIALDSADNPHISYGGSAENYSLMYAYWE